MCITTDDGFSENYTVVAHIAKIECYGYFFCNRKHARQ